MRIDYKENNSSPIFTNLINDNVCSQNFPADIDFSGKFPSTYISNRSVSNETAYLFFIVVEKYKINVMANTENNTYQKCCELIAFLLTQETRIIVIHDRWLYFFNGRIYEQCTSKDMLLLRIRELCENASLVWKNFKCSSSTAFQIYENVKQLAPTCDYPIDIRNYIVMNNGIYNLNTGFLESFSTERFITNMVVVNWDSTAESCPVFDSIINTYTQGDSVLAERLLEALGVCLTNDAVKKYICFLGITNSGKSFLVNLLLSLINDQSIAIMQPNDFDQRFAPSMIYGKSICACMDMDAAPLNTKATAFLKNISGFDTIGAEFKRENGLVMFKSRVHVILCSNFDIVPEIPDTALENRKLVIPFKHRISDGIIPFETLMEQLEKEKSAIVKKLVYAFLRLRANNYEFSGSDSWYNSYNPPTQFIQSAEDSIQQFLYEKYHTINDPEFVEFTDDMFERYQQYSTENNNVCKFYSFDAFSKCLKQIPNLSQGRRRKTPQSNPQSCYTGLVYKAPSPLLP